MTLGADLDRLRSLSGIKWTWFDPDVLPLWVADMDLAPAPVAVDAARAMLDRGDLGYNFDARRRLAAVWADWSERRHGWRPDAERIRTFDDVLQPIAAALHACTEPGDGVVLFTPIYPPFLEMLEKSGRRLDACPLDPDGWRFDADRLAAVVDDRTRAIVVCSPHNPTGRVLDAEELAAIAEIALARDLLVISDEIWQDIVHPGVVHRPVASLGGDLAERTVTVTAASKTFNLAGLQCAIAHLGHPVVAERIDAFVPHLLGGVNSLGAEATVAAWESGESWLAEVMDHLTSQRDHLVARLAADLPHVGVLPPEATYVAWLDFSAYELGPDPAERLLADAKVGLFPGPMFGPGGEGYARINFATSREVLDEALDRIAGALG